MLVCPLPPSGNQVHVFDLRKEECCQNIRHQERRSDIHPRVFVHLAPKEAASIGPLLANNFRPFCELPLVENNRSAFPANKVLRFVKAVGPDVTQRAQKSPLVFYIASLRRTFYAQITIYIS